MTTFQSTVSINKPVNEVYAFLADFNNHQHLMPDTIENWQSDYNTAKFGIQNMAKLSLKIENRFENSEIKIIPFDKAPFDLVLTWSISPVGNSTAVKFCINAELNMMMKMLASGPLQKLADHETASLISRLN